MANKHLESLQFPGLSDIYTMTPEIASEYSSSATYAVGDYAVHSGKLYQCTTAIATAEAWTAAHWTEAKLADDVSQLKEDIADIDGISDEVKEALLDCFQHVAWIDDQGQTYYDALEHALYPRELISISAVFDAQGATIYTDDSLDSLKQYLTVTATYDDSSTAVITDYTLSGTLVEGTSSITVTYSEKTTTFTIQNVVDFYNQWSWSSSATGANKLTLLQGAITTTNASKTGYDDIPYSVDDNSLRTRRGFAVERGRSTRLWERTNVRYSNYYPIPVPSGAVKITTSVTPSTQYVATYVFSSPLDGSEKYHMINQSDVAWAHGSQVINLESSNDPRYVCIAGKYDSGSSQYQTEPEITILFE